MCFLAVPVIGILAAIAIPQFINYVKRSKTSEATTQVKVIHAHLATRYQETSQLPESTPWTPASSPGSEKYAPSAAYWTGAWGEIGYRINDPHFYRYRFVKIDETSGRVEAQGDLDDDGELSLFSVDIGVDENGKLARSPSIMIENELE